MRRRVDSPEPQTPSGGWSLLPLTFHRLSSGSVAVSNAAGELVVLSQPEFEALMSCEIHDQALLRTLKAKHLVRDPDDDLPIELLAMKVRTRYAALAELTKLHIFVVTLRCEHSCQYCQVSRRSSNRAGYDMSVETADAALAVAFASPSRSIKLEFQGGEPFLNFGLIRHLVEQAESLAEATDRDVSFVVTSNLALLDDDIIDFCRDHSVFVSTSLDGPIGIHNANRPRPGGDSWQRTMSGIRRLQDEIGPDSVSALMTTSEASLGRASEIVDTYVEAGLLDIFLRPISPYGLALRTGSHSSYDVTRWLKFYREGLERILAHNRAGIPVVERYAAIILRKLLTNEDSGYVDLRSPSGIGIGALIYNYDGDVYASDEGRMLAEMKDHTFRLGNLHADSYEDFVLSEQLLVPLDESFALSAPMCSTCAFERCCGADPVFHHATAQDFLGRKPTSAFCQRNMGVFELILDLYHSDDFARITFQRWSMS